MKLNELQYIDQSKIGEIKLRYEEDSEPENRGFTVDKITAFHQGEPVGYLKLSYVPKEKFRKFFPSVFNFSDQINGTNYLPYKKRTQHWKTLSESEKRKIINYYFISKRWDKRDVADALPSEQVDPMIRRIGKELIKKGRGRGVHNYRDFYAYFVDKPFVDYINVEDEYQRQGIGMVLYRAGAQWMKERGMKMYASGLQSDEAKAAWEKMEKVLNVQRDKKRRYLEPKLHEHRLDELRVPDSPDFRKWFSGSKVTDESGNPSNENGDLTSNVLELIKRW